MTRRDLLVLAAPRLSGDASSRGVAWLRDRQSPATGGWPSQSYGLLRSGQSLTPFVLLSLLSYCPPNPRALAFLNRLRTPDPLDYPTYSAALTVLCGVTAPLPYVLSRQFQEAQGWPQTHAAFGGWGIGGDLRTPPHPGHVDLSMTRYALQALRVSGLAPDHPAFSRALVFLARCQNDDGGFQFSPVVLDANKAGMRRSYGTATADGILALLAAGVTSGARLAAARSWLLAHHRPDAAPGFPRNAAYARWPQGLRYYYAAASAEAFRRLGLPRDHEQDRLLARQARPDGSWANPEPLVKEDDPLIATGFALQALSS